MAINFNALHQYSDDSEIVSLVKFYADGVDSDGIVRVPGKFEGEPIHTVYFWGWMLNGDGDTTYADCEHAKSGEDCDCELEHEYTTFHVTAGDVEAFPVTLAGMAGRDIAVREDSVGFVYSWIMPEAPADPAEDLLANPYL